MDAGEHQHLKGTQQKKRPARDSGEEPQQSGGRSCLEAVMVKFKSTWQGCDTIIWSNTSLNFAKKAFCRCDLSLQPLSKGDHPG